MAKNILFYAPEGAGKTTQAKMLAEKLGVPCLISGDLVRRMAENDKGIMGEICRETLAKGHYVADSEMFVLWKARLKDDDTQNGWVIDGFPRNLTQAEFLADKLDKYGKQVDLVVYLKVSEEVSIARLLKRGRKLTDGSLHDSAELIKQRLSRYQAEEASVLEYYRKLGVLVEINGEREVEAIHLDILARATSI
ncbi:MAG: Adenylate kinase [Microgenomates group bacterium GW2011_GWA2_46_7]|nr:MAG: Adenylate kinase [Microgenomates group bacterium GW2011_GWA2_46_7]